MIVDRLINYQADDKAWAARFKKRDEDAAKTHLHIFMNS